MAELKKLQENGVDIYPVTLEDVVFDSNGNTLPNKYQTKEDSTLNTTDKTIVGAINELFQCGNNVKQNLVDALVAKGVSCSTSDSFDTLINDIASIKSTVSMPTWIANRWIQSSDISRTLIAAGIIGYGDYIYIIGGNIPPNSSDGSGSYTSIDTVVRFNTKTGKKTTMANAIEASNYQGKVVLKGSKIYTVGNKMYCYDINSNSWSTFATETGMYSSLSACCIIGNDIYMTGGYERMYDDNDNYLGDNSPRNYCYNILTKTYTEKATMTLGRYTHTCSIVDSKIYVIGGEIDSYYTKTIECYDPSTNTWTQKTDMPSDKYRHVAEAIGTNIYVIGGNNINASNQSANYCYNTLTNTWTTKSAMPVSREYAFSAISNGWIYVMGGMWSTTAYKTNYCYIP